VQNAPRKQLYKPAMYLKLYKSFQEIIKGNEKCMIQVTKKGNIMDTIKCV